VAHRCGQEGHRERQPRPFGHPGERITPRETGRHGQEREPAASRRAPGGIPTDGPGVSPPAGRAALPGGGSPRRARCRTVVRRADPASPRPRPHPGWDRSPGSSDPLTGESERRAVLRRRLTSPTSPLDHASTEYGRQCRVTDPRRVPWTCWCRGCFPRAGSSTTSRRY
jgi:hypothetical protein